MAEIAVKGDMVKECPELKRNYPVFRLMFGNIISFFGSQFTLIAIPLIVLSLTGSAVSMGIVAALERLPVLLQPFMGTLADRSNRKLILFVSDLGRAFLIGLLGSLYIFHHLDLGFLYSVSFILGVLSQLYNTSQFASVPGLVRSKDLQTVNALNTGFFNAAVLVAPGLGGLLISLYQPGMALFLDSLSFFLSFLAVLSIPFTRTTDNKSFSFIADLKEGFRFVLATRPIFYTNLAMFLSVFGTTLFLTVMIFHLKETVHLTALHIGWLLSLGGLGAIAGAVFTSQLKKRFSYRGILFSSALVGGCSIILFSLTRNEGLLIAMNGLGTFCASMKNPCILTIRQTFTPSHLLGRVQATSRFMTWGMMPVAAFLAGVLSAQIGTGTVILIGGCLSTVAAFIYLHPSLKI